MSLKVAIAGASGNLGPAVLEELLNAGFSVTVLTRADKDSKNNFDSRAQVAQVDYSSVESLRSALTGHDVVVNTLGAIPRDIHLKLVDAAVAAQVQRFIPSEFGSDTTNPNASQLPIYADKVAIQQYLREKSEASGGKFTYTLLVTGPFLDWGLMVGFLLNLSGAETDLYDGGDRKFSATTLAGVGKGISGIIRNLDATKNRTLFIRETEVTQNQLLGLLSKKPVTKSVSTEELEKDAYAELGKPAPNPQVFVYNFLWRTIFGGKYGSLFPAENLSNDLLGIKPLSEEELGNIVSKYGN